jgi:methylenetetrahydrofolate--tRNA-(uracil-5-)-methyltransferase
VTGHDRPVTIVGGGLAGCEAALQLAARGFRVTLLEMRPARPTPAHRTDRLAEIVCSNSFKSERSDTPAGALKLELDLLGCRLLPLARQARVPAGAALGLDRELFAALVGAQIEGHPRIMVRREEARALPEDRPCVVATGPLTSEDLERDLTARMGEEGLYFYDAIAPSLLLESVDLERAFRAARYGKGDDDYLNCPLDRAQYEAFVDALLAADRVPLHEFEEARYFAGCMPIEAIAQGGRESLRFGPMRPVGLRDPRSGQRPYAVVQLRQETRDGTLYGLVGFQTRLKYGEQTRVFRMIPALAEAEFARLGSLHRNTFLNSPRHLRPDLSWQQDPQVWFAGQMIGCEGYVESVATGLLAALAVAGAGRGRTLVPPPVDTLLGSLLAYLRAPATPRLTPMNVNFGLLPPLSRPPRDKALRREAHTARAVESMRGWVQAHCELFELVGV